MKSFVMFGLAFWAAYFLYWFVLWTWHVNQHWDAGRPMPFLQLRGKAIELLGMIGAGLLMAVFGLFEQELPGVGVGIAFACGVAVGFGHFLVFPRAWWRGHGWFWNIE